MKLSDILRNFLKKPFSRTVEAPAQPEEPRVGFVHAYPTKENPYTRITFVNKDKNIRRTIVDQNGRIHHFPGIAEKEKIESFIKDGSLEPTARYQASCEKHGNGYIMFWTVQPDGRYWEDEDGFGGTSDEEVLLYALMDEDGCFTGPFRPYRVGIKSFFDEAKTTP